MREIISETKLRDGVRRLARRISNDYYDQPLTIVGILQDSIILLADLMRLMDIPSQMCVVHSRRAHFGPDQPATLDIDSHTANVVNDRHVLIVDDVLDTGWSLFELTCELDNHNPLSVRSAVLLRKHERQEVTGVPDHVVFDVADEVIVGYGLDCNGFYRNLPYIAALDPEDVAATKTGGNRSADGLVCIGSTLN